jgi:hypothetical protein
MREADARQLAQAIQRDFPDVAPTTGLPWDACPPVKVIDCVLSLHRPYYGYVLPRVRGFVERFGDIRTCVELRRLADRYPSPIDFMADVLRTRDERRGRTLLGVVDFVIDVQPRFEADTEEERLRKWAIWARPGDYLAVDVPGFGLAGFQYLRMLFGAQTTKPDVHIVAYVSRVLGREVSDTHALYALERAAEIAGLPVRWLDAAIWDASAAGPSSPSTP